MNHEASAAMRAALSEILRIANMPSGEKGRIGAVAHKARAALAAPARNCDIYPSYDDALGEYLRQTYEDGVCTRPNTTFGQWLLEEAKGQ